MVDLEFPSIPFQYISVHGILYPTFDITEHSMSL